MSQTSINSKEQTKLKSIQKQVLKKLSYYTEQTRILSNQTYTLFLLQVFDSIEKAAEEFVLISKHMYIRDQPHAAHILLENSIKHKKPPLSYWNRLRPLNASARTTATTSAIDTTVIPQPLNHLSLPRQKTIRENKLSFSLKMMMMMKETRWKKILSLVKHYPLNVSCFNYNSGTNTNLSERKKFLKLLKSKNESK